MCLKAMVLTSGLAVRLSWVHKQPHRHRDKQDRREDFAHDPLMQELAPNRSRKRGARRMSKISE